MITKYNKIDFHYEGLFCTAYLKEGKIKKVLCDGIKLDNITDEMKKKIYKKYQAQNN